MKKSVEEEKRKIIEAFKASLPKVVQTWLAEEIKKANSADEFVNSIMVGNCPKCGGSNTRDCEDSPLNDPCVGICLDCQILWCLECGYIFAEGETCCGHWQICDECKFQVESGEGIFECKAGYDGCIDECPTIQEWK